jgi:hypothetical protein
MLRWIECRLASHTIQQQQQQQQHVLRFGCISSRHHKEMQIE